VDGKSGLSGSDKKRKAVLQFSFQRWSSTLDIKDRECWLCEESVVGKEEISQVWVCTQSTTNSTGGISPCNTPFHAACLTKPDLLTKIMKCPCCDNLRKWLSLGTPIKHPETAQVIGYSVHDSQRTYIAQLMGSASA
jgi:hypothetical protein